MRFRPNRAALFALGFLVATLGAWILIDRGSTARTSKDVVAIAPFRVAGADPSLAYLREGLVDLLAAKLTGEGGPRSVDPRTMIAAWQQAAANPTADLPQERAIEVAATVGAGQLLLGDLTGTAARIVINAYVLTSPGGRELARSTVSGPQDSLPQLLDRLAAELLIGESREGEHRTATLTSTSLPALRSYLAGRAAYRRGAYRDALVHFSRALELDSTFALAAMMVGEARVWTGDDFAPPFLHAWTHVQRLSRRDSLLLVAWVGTRAPRPPSLRESREALQQASEAAPDRPEIHFWQGDWLLHFGPHMGIADWQDLAGRAFSRALELDSAFAAPIEHLIDIAGLRGDTTEVRRLGRLYFARDSVGDLADYVRWRVATVTRDHATLSALRARANQIPRPSLVRIVGVSEQTGINREDQAVYARAMETPHRSDDPSNPFVLFSIASNHGKPEPRRRVLKTMAETGFFPGMAEVVLLREVLASSADSSGLGEALMSLSRMIAGGGDAAWPLRAAQLEWEMFNGRLAGAAEFIARLARDSATVPGAAETAITLDAEHAVLARRADADQRVADLDSLLLQRPQYGPPIMEITLARLYEMRGNPRRALEVVRRRGFHMGFGPFNLAGALRDEGRYAAAAGDRAGAILAYERYLALRSDAESAADRAEIEQIKRELARLTTEVRR